MRNVVTVNTQIPAEDELFLDLESDRSLLDADIIVFTPGIPAAARATSYEQYNGKPLLSEHWSFRLREMLAHWRTELELAVQQGKTVVVYLEPPEEVFIYTGEKQFSGTGRSRQTTNIVAPLSSYAALPVSFTSIVPKGGEAIKVAADLRHVAQYWSEMGGASAYEVHVDGEFSRVVLTTKTGERVVGAEIHDKGMLVILPPVQYDEAAFTEVRSEKAADTASDTTPTAEADASEDVEGDDGEVYWTAEAVAFGKRWLQAIISIDESFRSGAEREAEPAWASSNEYRLPGEAALEQQLREIAESVRRLGEERTAKIKALEDEGSLRALLYAKGKQLEGAIVTALRLMGFAAEPFQDAESEFDAIFTSTEGRFLGEAEGKDGKAINIDKLSQLERNIQEDFEKEGTTAYAKPVLFGNAFRLQPLNDRGDFFTAKCRAGARRTGAALVRTPDLFMVARSIRVGASEDFATACRKAIFVATGTVVTFPTWAGEGPAKFAGPNTDA